MYYAFQLSAKRRVEEADYNTFVYPLLHPDRVMQQHDFLYILSGEWEVALEYEGRPERFYSVPEIAREFCVSEKTLNNRFRTVHNKTFYAWQMDQKLDSVYRALRNNPDSTLKEIAVNFGFYDEFHLSRTFKKKFGSAPKYVR